MNCDTVYKCISIGPSLVDMIFCLDPQTYNNVLKSLKAEPGDWISIEEINTLKQLLSIDFVANFSKILTKEKNIPGRNLGGISTLVSTQMFQTYRGRENCFRQKFF